MDEILNSFYAEYEDGLEDEKWIKLGKKYDDRAIVQFFDELDDVYFMENDEFEIVEDFMKILSKSALISTFEKIALRNYFSNIKSHKAFVNAVKRLYLNGMDEFDNLVATLSMLKDEEKNANAAKWPIVSTICNYMFDEAYPVKPTTVKAVAKLLKTDIYYSSKPNLETYQLINQMYEKYRQSNEILRTNDKRFTHAILYTYIMKH